MTVSFYTLGCKVNQYETESMKNILLENGFSLSENGDIAVVNSCTVTAESDRKTRQLLNRIRNNNPSSIIVLTGCMPQAHPDKVAEFNADIVVGNTSKRDILLLINNYLKNRKKLVELPVHEPNEEFCETPIRNFSEKTRAFMKIEDGCNRACTYCIIPKARGRVRSRELSAIKKEAEVLSVNGYKEIVLTGINLSSYHYGLENAVKTVANVDGISRVRLGSLEPDLMTKELLLALKEIPEFCPNFHLSLQAGCNNTLKRMNRLYTKEEYENLVKQIFEIFDNPSITTDVMVGFAGEDENDFLESLKFVEDIGFAHTHIFPYSIREGTFAAKFKDQVTKSEKSRRVKLMEEAAKKAAIKFNTKQIGKILPVLIESDNTGYTENYVKVSCLDDAKEGEIVKIKISSCDESGLYGHIEK